MERAKAEQADVLLVDTAGRLQNKVNLMKELEKLNESFNENSRCASRSSLSRGRNYWAKCDDTSQTVQRNNRCHWLSFNQTRRNSQRWYCHCYSNELHLPVKLVGLGEGINDLEPFNANDFAMGLFKGLLKDV